MQQYAKQQNVPNINSSQAHIFPSLVNNFKNTKK